MSANRIYRDPEALLTEVDVADLLRLSIRTLQSWRIKGFGPSFIRAGRAIRYRRSDIDTWVAAQVVTVNAPGANA